MNVEYVIVKFEMFVWKMLNDDVSTLTTATAIRQNILNFKRKFIARDE